MDQGAGTREVSVPLWQETSHKDVPYTIGDALKMDGPGGKRIADRLRTMIERTLA